jgi:hypothetical protein
MTLPCRGQQNGAAGASGGADRYVSIVSVFVVALRVPHSIPRQSAIHGA